MTARPLVSCVLPTRDRPFLAAQAVRYFLRQDYPARELVVVDTGIEPAPLPADHRIRRLRPDGPLTVGAARNLGNAAARGELLAHWDDDDWIGPDRLSRQVAALQRSGAAACGLGALLYYRPANGDAWRYRPLPGDRPFLAGGTLLYRREAWAAQRFLEIDCGEDGAFVAALGDQAVLPLPDDGWYVALLHGRNTAAKDLGDPRWSEGGLDEVAARIGRDGAFYAAMRTGRLAALARQPRGDSVTVASDLLVYDGLGGMAEYAALGMARAGADVRLAPITLDRAGLRAETLALLERRAADGPVLYWSTPRPELEAHARRPELFVRAAWESSRLPADWPGRFERARALLAASTHVADACRASGVTVPMAVVPDGVDPAVHHWQRRPERPGVTTLIVATLIPRKHLPEALAAWRLAFGDDPDARLLVKARFQAGRLAAGDPRVRVVDDEQPTRGIAGWYRQADVLLALGNEGFGLPLVEGMASGLPVVALASEGQADICREAGALVLQVPPARLAPYRDPAWGECGLAAVPDVEAAAARLRWVAAHPEEARELGRAASAWAVKHRNVWHMGPTVLDVLERHTAPARTLRRRRTLWVPSWQRRCGIGEYARELLRELHGGAGVSAAAPDRRGLRLLHVQHEDGLFDDATLADYLERVDAPVVVTEHTVGPVPKPWEERAAALVALTSRGAAELRARAGGRPVAHLPHGCPEWFPPRKARRGRVIGSFGFMEPYKGFHDLLEVLRALPGTELVLYSHSKDPAFGREFERAAAGLPVRWCRDYLPAERVARRLAAECDLLAFWYDEVPHASASGAVRVGLASGVPVLTSRTSWFEDLGGATYQPEQLTEGVAGLLEDGDLRDDLVAAARDHCTKHGWRRVAADHLTLWQSVERP
jgi:glycosyltransferase involved in cell wall biosynthesis